MMLELNISEAQEQLREAQDEIDRIKAKIISVQAQGTAVAAATKDLADKLMAGEDVSTLTLPRLTGTQVRHAVQALEGALAEAQSKASQAQSALRRARITRLKALLEERKVAFDAKAAELLAAYADVSVLHDRLAAVTGVDGRPSSWFNLAIPRGVMAKVPAFFDPSIRCSRGQDVTGSGIGAAAAARLAAQLKQEGIE